MNLRDLIYSQQSSQPLALENVLNNRDYSDDDSLSNDESIDSSIDTNIVNAASSKKRFQFLMMNNYIVVFISSICYFSLGFILILVEHPPQIRSFLSFIKNCQKFFFDYLK
jgi:hypothetical protein